VSLIITERHTPEDLEAWAELRRLDLAWSRTAAFASKVMQAHDHIHRFATGGPFYASVSWGKDSVCMVHMLHSLGIKAPVAWVRRRICFEPDSSISFRRFNPDLPQVRDAFLDKFPVDYHEIVIDVTDPDSKNARALAAGFQIAEERFGRRTMTGIRADESGDRRMRGLHGAIYGRTCAPLIDWSLNDVFAYLAAFDVPIAPVYAYSFGGSLGRRFLRVSSLGGDRGEGMGRKEWEQAYYPG
jgi:phosphoadenosine phosphosulfate reductase